MRLTVLGGAAAGGNPGQGCSGYLVQDQGTSVVLDLGPATLPELRLHADYRTLDAIVVSHMHLDHMLDLLALRYTLDYNPRKSGRPLPIWLPPGGLAYLGRVAAALERDGDGTPFFGSYDAAEYDPATDLSIGRMTLQFERTAHYVPCWAIRVSAVQGNQDLVYTADTGPTAELAAFASGAAVLIAEVGAATASSEPPESRGHLTPREAAGLAAEAGVERLILTHYWVEDDPLLAVRQANQRFPGSVVAASPGMIVEW